MQNNTEPANLEAGPEPRLKIKMKIKLKKKGRRCHTLRCLGRSLMTKSLDLSNSNKFLEQGSSNGENRTNLSGYGGLSRWSHVWHRYR